MRDLGCEQTNARDPARTSSLKVQKGPAGSGWRALAQRDEDQQYQAATLSELNSQTHQGLKKRR